MSTPTRRFRIGLAVLFVASSALSAQPQRSISPEALRALLSAARFTEAEAGARTLLAEAEAVEGPDSVRVAEILQTLVEALWRGGKVRAPETKPHAERSIAISEKQLGPDHPLVGYGLATLGIVLRMQADYNGAKARLERALNIQERALGANHPDVARTLTVTAVLATDTGDLAQAEALQRRALAIRERHLTRDDASIADNLNGLGVIAERQGDLAGAERYHQQALALRQKALGPEHPDVATSLNNLGNVHEGLGNYSESRSFHERALTIRERALGSDHPDVAISLNNLSIAIRDLGDHAGAWWLLERVLGIWEKALGPEHPNVAFTSHNLATILVDIGEDAGNRLLIERARRSRESSRDARLLASSLNSLVGVAPPSTGYRGAQALLERALAIKEKALGPSHTSVALTLTTLATVHRKLGEPERARPHLERALAIREKAQGTTHPDVADTLDRLGELLHDIGDHAAARPVFERVLAIVEQIHGPDHPHAGIVRQHLAESFGMAGDAQGALQMALEAERVGRDHLQLIGRTLPEREALMYAATRPVGSDVALTLLALKETSRTRSSAAVWDSVVRSRAMVLDEMASRHRSVGSADQPELVRLAKDLATKRDQLATLVVRGPSGSSEQYRNDLQRAKSEREAAERALAERSVQVRQERIRRGIGLDEVRKALPPQSALVAFVRYRQYPFGVSGRSTQAPDRLGAAYLAFVMRADTSEEPVVVPLGSAAPIDSEIARWRKQMNSVALAGGRMAGRAEAAVRRSGALLRARIWDPIARELAGRSRVFIVPDGPLHLVNWDALPTGTEGYLIEQAPLLHYLSAERDLVRSERADVGRGLLVVDSPNFNDVPVEGARAAAAAMSGVFRGPRSGCGDFRSMRFDPLPASAREADAIARIWRQSAADSSELRLSGRMATEAAFKQRASGARVLHLATHGFFLGGRCASAIGQADDRRTHDAGPEAVGENPLLLAGFALTGANQRRTSGQDAEDGILTAEEVAALDLSGVEWAVMSACDTGLGEVRAGEGVFGLRRAFQIAGARTVIMSLWPVDDENTRRWMTGVYERRFARGMETMEAVRQSSLDELRRRRRAGLGTHPFYWAGFIAAGDWQ